MSATGPRFQCRVSTSGAISGLEVTVSGLVVGGVTLEVVPPAHATSRREHGTSAVHGRIQPSTLMGKAGYGNAS